MTLYILRTDTEIALRHSIEIDPKLVEQLSIVQTVCLAASGGIALMVLAAWFFPAAGTILPGFWSLTKATTMVALFAATSALALAYPRSGKAVQQLSRLLALFAGLIALAVLTEDLFHTSFQIELMLPYNHASPTLGRMSPVSAVDLMLISIATLLLSQRKTRLAVIADLVVSALALTVLANTAGSIFGATRLFGSSINTVAPCTMACLILLTFVVFGRRAESGAFAIMLGRGLGSRVARLAFPLALLVPFALETTREMAVRRMILSPAYASAISTTLAVLLAFGLILILAFRMLHLEQKIHDLSLLDELTKVYNRRGFFIMAEQALWLARRSDFPFFVIYIDLDGLKAINDSKGHEVGSAFIQEAADLLKNVVRRTDIVGRLGGDEFVVAGQSDEEHVRIVVDRVRAAAEERNSHANRRYPFSLSLGRVSSDGSESLQELLQQADTGMYASKVRKKAQRL